MSTPTTAPAAGWYTDPATPTLLRWWDGSGWTPQTAPVPVASPAPYAPAAAAVVPYPERRPTGTSPSDPAHWLLPTGRSGWSIAAGYVALFALVLWPLGPVALACGVLGLRHSARTGTHGRGRAWFGVVVGALATLGCVWASLTWR